MSTPTSPRRSSESAGRPEFRDHTIPAAGSGHTRSLSGEVQPRSHRRSIQFSVDAAESQLPTRSSSFKEKRLSYGDTPRELEEKEKTEREHKAAQLNRGPSPPPPKTYERGVSFDTFDNFDATDFSLTLNYKHKGYQSTRRSRTFLCGTDQNDYSEFALEWLIDELVDDGDEIVCLRAVEKDSRIASDVGIEERKYREEAQKLFEQVIQKNSQDEKAISLVLELAVGKVESIIQRMIRIYEPAMLVVGTRGRNLKGVHSLLPGSVSKYCLQQSPIPVIVVRPSPKREKKKKKRRADPTRRSYNHILEMSEQRGSQIFGASPSTDSSTSKLPDEEAAVAEALGLPASYSNAASRSSLSVSDRSSISISHDDSDTNYPRNSLDAMLMASPGIGSPADSSQESILSTGSAQPSPLVDRTAVSPSLSNHFDSPASDSSTEIDKSDEANEVSNSTKTPLSIPMIEVSENDDKNDNTKASES
ncbi:UspA [Penicillium concentricum]|uniref:UspA n=1 Tax=Penicillium concentricum TaxID=293559 RepID=A0A9W9S743_9EURO|nr:UspA [Penicillium concentricum]KAJ5373282.1 UspA [Penicillium concentricum]